MDRAGPRRLLATRLRFGVAFALAVLVVVLVVVWRGHAVIGAGLARCVVLATNAPRRVWLGACLLVGVALRLGWVLAFPTPQLADGAAYVGLARSLLDHGTYTDEVARLAFWPPGLPLFLYVLFTMLGVHGWVPALANLLLFAATVPLVERLARTVADDGVARLACLALACWPNHIAHTGLASKELLLTPLLTLALLLYLQARTSPGWRASARAAGSGGALGYAALTQPSWLLFPAAIVVSELVESTPARRWLPRLALLLAGMAAVVAPWTVRNLRALDALVLVSTNGGDVFYRANNPRATGGFVPQGQIPLAPRDELARGRTGYRLGLEWIARHPADFAVLALRKQVLLLGDDAGGIFETLKRGRGLAGRPYAAAKALANAYWWVACVLVLTTTVYLGGPPRRASGWALLVVCLPYLVLLHSVFESGSRHHLPLVGVVAILALWLARKR